MADRARRVCCEEARRDEQALERAARSLRREGASRDGRATGALLTGLAERLQAQVDQGRGGG